RVRGRELFATEFGFGVNGPRLAAVMDEVRSGVGVLSDELNLLLAGFPAVGSVWSGLRDDKTKLQMVKTDDDCDIYSVYHRLGEALEELGHFDEPVASFLAFHKVDQPKNINGHSLENDMIIDDEANTVDHSTKLFNKNHPAAPYLLNHQLFNVDIVVPVYNALDHVKECLVAIAKNTDDFQITTYVVNDGSELSTTVWLKSFCKQNRRFFLIENQENQGYTKTVNIGLRATSADYVVIMNSDAVVTKGWLQGLVRCIRSEPQIGIVGPLSNAASWQNVPDLLDENGQFAVNALPERINLDSMSQLVAKESYHEYPKVPFLNGFCLMIGRPVIDAIGFMDEDTFPIGYGEENDYCIRAADAGFMLAIADDVYVFHAKSKSFGHDQRKVLSKHGSDNLKVKHGKEKLDGLVTQIRNMPVLDSIRKRVSEGLKFKLCQHQPFDPLSKRVIFLLPVSGGGGGVHSIVQETMGMRRIGVEAKIAVPNKHIHKFLKNYDDIEQCEDLFLGFQNNQDIAEISKGFDVIIGTIYKSMKIVKSVLDQNSNIKSAYYIQDYEPFFCKPGTADWQEARESYNLVPGCTLFAKTQWLCDKIFDEHGVMVHKVSPSIDHDVYKPNHQAQIKTKYQVVLSAMVRPKTPRRGAERTMRILKIISDTMKDKVKIEIFGCQEDDPLFNNLERNFKYRNHGVLTRSGVAKVLQMSDCFVDLSDYQAFGRTALEAMACGATAILPKWGGVAEYVVPFVNGITVNTFDEREIIDLLFMICTNYDQLSMLKSGALMTSSFYSIHRASVSEIMIL
ncbi:glycosyltransferase, partial [Arthrospira platensis SPKY2]